MRTRDSNGKVRAKDRPSSTTTKSYLANGRKLIAGWGMSLDWYGTPVRGLVPPKSRAPGRYNWS